KKPMDIKIITIDDKMVHVDDAMTVEFYHITDNPHAKSLLMAYFPAQKILYQADVYSSGATYHPFAAKFLEMLKGLDLDIERIIPVHGSIATYDDLVKAVGE
ncbi:MAG: hypothetical protein HOH19_05985, partial [Kordiimonadaceae bacterium]|nr:hypothetical protein [Kordiimonadaceae bacterium]